MNDIHLDAESLAAFADGNRRGLPPRLWKHVLRCPACQGKLVEAVRVQHAWMEGAARAPIDPALRSLAEGIPGLAGQPLAVAPSDVHPAATNEGSRLQPLHSRQLRPRRSLGWLGIRWLRPLTVAAGAAVVVGGIVLLISQLRESGPRDSAGKIENAILLASSLGMALPGGELAGEGPSAIYRGDLSQDAALLLELEVLERRLAASPGTMAEHQMLIGGDIAAGRLQAANDHIDRVPESSRNEPGLLVLRAVLAYRNSDLDTAEMHLRNAVRSAPNDPLIRFDLAWVLSETGRRSEAAVEIDAVQRLAPGSPLARRAERLR